MTWAKSAANNLLPLSKSKNFGEALKEWFYNGENYDLVTPDADCELCDHPEIRYQFGIFNNFTNEKLLVGSECITKFGISVIENNQILSKEDAIKKVHKDRNKLITDAKFNRVISALIELGNVDSYFASKIESFIGFYKDKNGFTPNQLLLLMKSFKNKNIKYQKNDFKLKFSRSKDREQLLALSDTEIQALWSCLSKPQQVRYMKLKNDKKMSN